jgi:hypothetical protein
LSNPSNFKNFEDLTYWTIGQIHIRGTIRNQKFEIGRTEVTAT